MKALHFLFFLCINFGYLASQDCGCSIMDVENNTVIPCDRSIGEVITVSTVSELMNAINQTNAEGGNKTILIEDGTYHIAATSWFPYITGSNIVFRSLSGNRDEVVLTGSGMQSVAPDTEHGFYCLGNNITIADLTIRDVGNHGISVEGDSLYVHNVKIQNTYEQMIKGNSSVDGSDNSLIQCSLLEYPDGIGPQFYIGGIDVHDGDNWIVRDNIFRNISSPSQSLAEHAIHFWNFSSNNIVERNSIINCDRGIGFGLGASPNDGGIIRNNMIYNDGSNPFNDVGIGLETSPNTKVYNNTIYIDYQNAIEYRFPETNNVLITNNLTNRLIRSRNDGEAILLTNVTDAEASWFEDYLNGNLRILSEVPTITDQGSDLTQDVVVDIDKNPRPQNNAYDIGASEYSVPTSIANEAFTYNVNVFPNPATDLLTIKSELYGSFDIVIYNSLGKRITSFTDQKLVNGLDVSVKDWPEGFYFCAISSDLMLNRETIKIVITD